MSTSPGGGSVPAPPDETSAGVDAVVDDGTVSVTRPTPAAPDVVWRALTDPGVVCRWFGTLLPGLDPGQTARFDFGDGDFFTVHDIRLDPPHRLCYRWRFLGIGPVNTITWTVEPDASGSRVTVTDAASARTRASAVELREGWLDFTARFVEFLATGTPTRYDWRRSVDAAIEMPVPFGAAAQVVFAPGRFARWLPLDGFDLEPGISLYVEDGATPKSFALTNVSWSGATRVAFDLRAANVSPPTSCEVALTLNRQTPLFTVRHTGFDALDATVDVQRQQRKRFCAYWIECLTRARDLVRRERTDA